MKTVEIILCKKCLGNGVTLKEYLMRGTDSYKICAECNGSGRMKKITEIIYQPYKGLNKKGVQDEKQFSKTE